MRHRIARNLLSALLLAGYCLIAGGTSEQRVGYYGESPLELLIVDNAAYLLERTNDPAEGFKGRKLRVSRVMLEGPTELLYSSTAPTTPTLLDVATVVTTTTEGPFAFAMIRPGSLAVVFPPSSTPQTATVDTGDRDALWLEGSQLAVIERNRSRQWVFVAQHIATSSNSFLPLFEISDNHPRLIANNVVWVACFETGCQQLRMEDAKVRLYASPATAEDFFTVITESTLPSGNGHYACIGKTGAPTVVIGETAYSLSTTYPSMATTPLTSAGRDCTSPPFHEVHIDRMRRGNNFPIVTGRFATGETITIKGVVVDSVPEDCHDDCEAYTMKLWVYIDDEKGVRLNSYPLHAP